MKYKKRYIVITGASSGIGQAAAKAFAFRGKNLILVARRYDRLEKLSNELHTLSQSADVIIKNCDLSIPSNCYQLYHDLKPYVIEAWINNAGFGCYSSVPAQDLNTIESMLRLNVEAVTILSTLFVRDYIDVEHTQLINISSRGGYILVPDAVSYCASKFYVSAFTEGLAHELKAEDAPLQAKVLAPAATKTEFGKIANQVLEYDYGSSFAKYHTPEQMADFLMMLYDSDQTLGLVNWETFSFSLQSPVFEYSGSSSHNQR